MSGATQCYRNFCSSQTGVQSGRTPCLYKKLRGDFAEASSNATARQIILLVHYMTGASSPIGIDVQWAANTSTGIGKCCKHWIAALAELDAARSYVLLGGPRGRLPCQMARAIGAAPNFEYVEIDTSGRRNWGRLTPILHDQWLLPKAARSHGCTTLFYPYFNPSIGMLGRSLVTITDMDMFIRHTEYPFARQAYYNLLLKLSAHRALGFVAISESTKADAVRHLGVAADRITVVYPGLSDSFQPMANGEARVWCEARYGLHAPFILYTGGLAIRKNVRRMLNAFAKARLKLSQDVRLAMTGNILRDEVIADPAGDDSRRRIINLGSVAERELPYLYSAAELVLYPSLYEGFGLPIVEAQACGTPVITSNVSSMPEIAGDAAVLIDPRDEDEIAQAIVRLFADQGLREHLKRGGIENARRFTWSASGRRLMEVLEEHAA